SAFVTAWLFVVAVSAYTLWRNVGHNDTGAAGVTPPERERSLFRGAVRVGLVGTLIAEALTVFSGAHRAKLAARYGPLKRDAPEPLRETEEGAAFSTFAVGDVEEGYNPIDVTVPNVLSFLATGHFDGEVHGMNNLQEAYEEYYGPGDYIPNVFV